MSETVSQLKPMVLEYEGISVSLTPETVSLRDLVTVHACLTRSLVQAFQMHDPESLSIWAEEVRAALSPLCDRGKERGG